MGVPFISSRAGKLDAIIAVDVGGRTTKAVYVQRRGEKLSLGDFTVAESPMAEKGFSADVLTEHFREITRALGNRCKNVSVALGPNEAIFRQTEMPFVPITDLRQMLKFNSRSYLQQEFPDHVFDCQFALSRQLKAGAEAPKPAGANQKQKVMIGGARQQLLEDMQTAFKNTGLNGEQVIPGLIGPVNAFEVVEPQVFNEESVALVELGFKNSVITILDAGEIMLNRVVALGGDRLTQGLAEALNISYQEAENIKLGMPDEVATNLEPLIHPLGRELRASIDYYENHHDKTIQKVYFSGGSARSELVVQTLQAEMMVPCQVWAPTSSIQLALPAEKMSEVETVAPQLTVAIGTAVASF